MPLCGLGQSRPQIVHFWPNLGVDLAVNGVFGWKRPCVIPIPGFVNLAHEPISIWSASTAIFNHAHMSYGPNQSWSFLFLAKSGDQLGRKCCDWFKMPYTNSIPGFLTLAHEPILTLDCFCSSLQSCTHVIWAKVAPKLFIVGRIWRSAYQYTV